MSGRMAFFLKLHVCPYNHPVLFSAIVPFNSHKDEEILYFSQSDCNMSSVVVWKECRQDLTNTHTVPFSAGCDVTLRWALPTVSAVCSQEILCVCSVACSKGDWQDHHNLSHASWAPLYHKEAL